MQNAAAVRPTQVGAYVVEDELARGAMGTVYVARHHLTQAKVALKVLDKLAIDEDAIFERFQREVSAAAKVGHPGIVKVYDAGRTDDGYLYLAMELLEGADLEEFIYRPEVSRLELCELILAMLEPLAAAHRAGIVHRDLKPANVFVCQEDSPRSSRPSSVGASSTEGPVQVIKLVDFGIAKETTGGISQATQTGMVVGTPTFMSPEQSQEPHRVGPASDVWSVGVMLYEILTGRYPFDAQYATAIIVAACTKPHVPITDYAGDTPPELVTLVDRCLEKEPRNRPADAEVLAQELAAILERPDTRVTLGGTQVQTVPKTLVSGTPVPKVPSDAAAMPPTLSEELAPETRSRRGLLLGGLLGAVGAGAVTLAIVFGAGPGAPPPAALPGGASASESAANPEPAGSSVVEFSNPSEETPSRETLANTSANGPAMDELGEESGDSAEDEAEDSARDTSASSEASNARQGSASPTAMNIARSRRATRADPEPEPAPAPPDPVTEPEPVAEAPAAPPPVEATPEPAPPTAMTPVPPPTPMTRVRRVRRPVKNRPTPMMSETPFSF